MFLYFCKKNLLYKNNFYIFVKITDYEGEIGVFAKKLGAHSNIARSPTRNTALWIVAHSVGKKQAELRFGGQNPQGFPRY